MAATSSPPKLRPNGTQQWQAGMGSYVKAAKVASQWHPAMAPLNSSYVKTAKLRASGTMQCHPGMAATSSLPKMRPNGTQQGMTATSSPPKLRPNGAQQWQLRQPYQSCAPLAPRTGSYDDNLAKVASQWQLRQPRKSCVPMAPSCVPITPRNGTQECVPLAPSNRPGSAVIRQARQSCVQWHPAMAPRNGSYLKSAKVASNGTHQWRPGK